MVINGKKIASFLEKEIKKYVRKFKKHQPKLAVFLIGQSAEQLSFVKIKNQLAKKLGIKFEFIHYKNTPLFEPFVRKLREVAYQKETTAVIIQQPLPATVSTESIYDYIPKEKEIEGHHPKSPFLPPIGLAVLTVIKSIFFGGKINSKIIIDKRKDVSFFHRKLKNKKVVVVGQGVTGGVPIGKTLSYFKINYIGINSKTENKEQYYQEADIIITAVGKKVIEPSMLKPGVILINVGLRKENGKLKGDYDEKEIKNIASFYTATPGGIGPIDVAYLYKNLIDAVKLQLVNK
jgi:methylenetetrahydrofolate dehydrogenase (NADP+)/methenyltetrahydrofolate cyclohydrolase